MHYDLNNDWLYSLHYDEHLKDPTYHEENMIPVRIPHTNIETPYHCFSEKIYQFTSGYRRHLFAKKEWEGKHVFLTFDAVAHKATVFINGEIATVHLGGYTAFKVDIASYLDYGKDNIIAVKVESEETLNIPPFGYVIDYLTYGGIYREVSLDIKENDYIEDIFVTTPDTPHWQIDAHLTLIGADMGKGYLLSYMLTTHEDFPIEVLKGEMKVSHAKEHLICDVPEEIKAWNLDSPDLYDLEISLSDCQGTLKDTMRTTFGFRTCEFKKDGFYLNHEKIKLRGLNRHQSYPYVGYAMPRSMQEWDADLLKNELQVNAVRTSHYPQSQHFINRCDEIGLLVFTELPGWQHIGNEEWKETAIGSVREMVMQYRNHPSIILWGVRINESVDDDAFYLRTNQVAHERDATRSTGGVRYLQKSHLLEDVYTYNDFLHNGKTRGIDKKSDVTSDMGKAYLVSEYNGHMFPTKAFDDEAHRLEQALRHCTVLDAIAHEKDVAGGFGWCMFDYNTHKDFGSGDMICYHGVLDMFRNPKLAAYSYASQGEKDVFMLSSSLDIGDHPAGQIGDIYAFTNADSVKVYKNDLFIKEFFPLKSRFPDMPHAPILIDDFVGDLFETQEHYDHATAKILKEVLFAIRDYGQNNLPLKYKLKMAKIMIKAHVTVEDGVNLFYKYIGGWGGEATTYRFEAIRHGKVVNVIEKNPGGKSMLKVQVSSLELKEGVTYDVAQIRLQAINEFGSVLPYYQEPLKIEAEGPIALIGPDIISLKGGMGGLYIRTTGEEGQGIVHIISRDLGEQTMTFDVKKVNNDG